MNLDLYEVNIPKILQLDKIQRKVIYQMLDDMMILYREGVDGSAGSATNAKFLFRGLQSEGYVISSRDKKISGIVSDDN